MTNTASQRFDYIVVGAGSSGAVVASRLTEDPDVSVLLLEAGGPDRHPFIHMPMAFAKVWKMSRYNWFYETEPEPGLNGRRLPINRGKGLGGSSSVNGMQHIRGNRLDYDFWAQRGLAGWSYADVLPYFKRLETHWRGGDDYRGGDGPIQVSPSVDPANLREYVEAAAVAKGYAVNPDYNGATQEGVGRVENSTGGGQRSSTARGYLVPAMGRPNLTVMTHALTSQVLLENGRAVGVAYRRDGKQEKAYAEREVVLSAGSFSSPQILMLSGVGPADHLREFGIEVAHDLPGVGQNLSEHPNNAIAFRVKSRDLYEKYLRADRAVLNVLEWFVSKTGAFAEIPGGSYIFARSRPELARPDLQIIWFGLTAESGIWFPGVTRPPLWRIVSRGGLLHPRSRGWVKLRSADPADTPRIFFNMFSDPEDMRAVIRFFQLSREFAATQPLADFIEHEVAPGPDARTDADLEAYIRQTTGHRFHPIGTCTMGTDENAVVDAELKVRGIDGLRVVDASIMPDEPTGNTNVPSIMIGEKGADLIRGRSLPPAEV